MAKETRKKFPKIQKIEIFQTLRKDIQTFFESITFIWNYFYISVGKNPLRRYPLPGISRGYPQVVVSTGISPYLSPLWDIPGDIPIFQNSLIDAFWGFSNHF